MSTSNYPGELSMWTADNPAPRRRRDATVVAFLAIRSDVAAAVAAGFALTTIFRHMREVGRIACSYETFRKHSQRYITTPPPARPLGLADAPRAAVAGRYQAGSPVQKPLHQSGSSIGGFVFDATPNKEELL